VQSPHPKSLAEEAPLAYKDIEAVIDSVQGSGISTKVARFVPIGVIKG
jgi:tRNA-splicing ligase RtcB